MCLPAFRGVRNGKFHTVFSGLDPSLTGDKILPKIWKQDMASEEWMASCAFADLGQAANWMTISPERAFRAHHWDRLKSKRHNRFYRVFTKGGRLLASLS
jgi:hypothetical protein